MVTEHIIEPNVLYKYGKFDEYTEKIFTHNEIYFSSSDFNDPFDSKLCCVLEGNEQEKKTYLCSLFQRKWPNQSEEEILSYVKKLIKAKEGGSVLQEILKGAGDRLRKKFGIYCLTERKDNILMWAHYAKQHSGFCLEFKVNNEFFAPHARVIKVKYKATRPVVNMLQLNTYPKQKLGEKLLIKANDWKYEKEWRIVDTKKCQEIQNFPEDALSVVILGCRISQENKDNVFRWCGKRKHPPTLYEAREKQKEFGLDIVEIDYCG